MSVRVPSVNSINIPEDAACTWQLSDGEKIHCFHNVLALRFGNTTGHQAHVGDAIHSAIKTSRIETITKAESQGHSKTDRRLVKLQESHPNLHPFDHLH